MSAVRRVFTIPTLDLVVLLFAVTGTYAQETRYGYYYNGEYIALVPSAGLVAVSEAGVAFRTLINAQRLERHPLSNRPSLQQANIALYRTPAELRAQPSELETVMRRFATASGEVVQPVFEQGGALLVPSNELLVRFESPTDAEAAAAFVEEHRESQGIIGVRAGRNDTYILTIDNPANGRVYTVSQFFSGLDGLSYAEPNHTVVLLDPLDIPIPTDLALPAELMGPARAAGPGGGGGSGHNSPVVWTTLIEEPCEGTGIPAGWTTARWDATYPDVTWTVTTVRSHAGNGSCHATGGGADGVAAPGSYPHNVVNTFDSPQLDLAAYEEVYIEFWFYAKLGGVANDVAAVAIYNPAADETNLACHHSIVPCMIVGIASGDLTADPTTDNGWRRALVRVPPALRQDGMHVRFLFASNEDLTDEGVYIDQIRVVATTDVDTEPIGNDTYGARHYEMKNSGQIAGLGDDNNDMNVPEAWQEVAVSPNVVVAVIDEGVDLGHVDLNLTTGYEPDGSVGGDARGSHGTAVAGNVGAIGDNSLGVMGTAPGVTIMPVYIGTNEAEVADAIDVAVANGADILSNSWGWVGAPSQVIEDAIVDALAAGVTVLFAAGNGPDRPPYSYDVAFPGSLTGTTDVITVGASSPTDEHKGAASSDGEFLWGSSYLGDGPDVVAPSPWSYTTDRSGGAGYNPAPSWGYSLIDPSDATSEDYVPIFGGTSSATPKVAGVAALILSADPSLTPGEVKDILRRTADDIDAGGIDDKTGAGRVNAYAAVLAAKPGTICCIGCGAAMLVSIIPLFAAALWRRRMARNGD